jgi:hypothetical protein
MSERSYLNPEMDRTGWGPGPWDGEPDKVSWTDEATGMPCIAVRGNPLHGSWCGYVAVNPGHPYHGLDYSEVDVAVHGGLTYSAPCFEDEAVERAVCHVPEPGQPGDVWWLGFDCGHHSDVYPAYRTYFPEMWDLYERVGAQYRTLDWVKAECTRLASRLAEASGDRA